MTSWAVRDVMRARKKSRNFYFETKIQEEEEQQQQQKSRYKDRSTLHARGQKYGG